MTFTEELQKRQNSSESIEMLAAQRRLYSKAKRITLLIFILTVVVQVVLSICCTTIVFHIPKLSVLQDYFHMYTLVIIIVQYCLVRWISKFKEEASHIQLQFDMRVFNLKWDDRFLGPDIDNGVLVEKESAKLSQKYKKKLSNWYDLIELNGKQSNQVIRACQKQDLRWNTIISQRTNYIIQGFMIINGIIYFAMLWLSKVNIVQAINILANFTPLITWWIAVDRNYDKGRKNLGELSKLLNDERHSRITSLLIEAKATEYRKNSSLVPDCIYKLFRSKDNEINHRAQLNKAKDN